MSDNTPKQPLEFDGHDYVPPRDDPRLSRQFWRVFDLMKDSAWRTLFDMARITGDPPASISAQLRHMRKPRFGSHTVNKRYIKDGMYRYQLVVRREGTPPPQGNKRKHCKTCVCIYQAEQIPAGQQRMNLE